MKGRARGQHKDQAGAGRKGGWTAPIRPSISPLVRRGPPATRRAQVAQLVEHATENRSVGGSIPPLGTIKIKTLELTVPRV